MVSSGNRPNAVQRASLAAAQQLDHQHSMNLPRAVRLPLQQQHHQLVANWLPGECPLSGPAGLQNLGNTCYLNSCVQCLASAPPFATLCFRKFHSSGCSYCAPDKCFTCAVENLVRRLMQGPKSPAAQAWSLQKQVLQAHRSFVKGRQEDAHELLTVALDAMERDTHAQIGKEHRTVIEDLFQGRTVSSVTCKVCGYVSSTYEEFCTLSLDVRRGCSGSSMGSGASVSNGLAAFTAAEMLDGANKYKCDRCRKLVPARKQVLIHDDPNVLIVHLKRFDAALLGGKITGHVVFQETLDLAPYLAPQTSPTQAAGQQQQQHHAHDPSPCQQRAGQHPSLHAQCMQPQQLCPPLQHPTAPHQTPSQDQHEHQPHTNGYHPLQQQQQHLHPQHAQQNGCAGPSVVSSANGGVYSSSASASSTSFRPGPVQYRLTGVLVHHGNSVHSGHYYAYVLDPKSTWHLANDASVQVVLPATVHNQQAYMLTYVRNTIRPSRPRPPPPPAAPATATTVSPSIASAASAGIPRRVLSARPPVTLPPATATAAANSAATDNTRRKVIYGPQLPPAAATATTTATAAAGTRSKVAYGPLLPHEELPAAKRARTAGHGMTNGHANEPTNGGDGAVNGNGSGNGSAMHDDGCDDVGSPHVTMHALGGAAMMHGSSSSHITTTAAATAFAADPAAAAPARPMIGPQLPPHMQHASFLDPACVDDAVKDNDGLADGITNVQAYVSAAIATFPTGLTNSANGARDSAVGASRAATCNGSTAGADGQSSVGGARSDSSDGSGGCVFGWRVGKQADDGVLKGADAGVGHANGNGCHLAVDNAPEVSGGTAVPSAAAAAGAEPQQAAPQNALHGVSTAASPAMGVVDSAQVESVPAVAHLIPAITTQQPPAPATVTYDTNQLLASPFVASAAEASLAQRGIAPVPTAAAGSGTGAALGKITCVPPLQPASSLQPASPEPQHPHAAPQAVVSRLAGVDASTAAGLHSVSSTDQATSIEDVSRHANLDRADHVLHMQGMPSVRNVVQPPHQQPPAPLTDATRHRENGSGAGPHGRAHSANCGVEIGRRSRSRDRVQQRRGQPASGLRSRSRDSPRAGHSPSRSRDRSRMDCSPEGKGRPGAVHTPPRRRSSSSREPIRNVSRQSQRGQYSGHRGRRSRSSSRQRGWDDRRGRSRSRDQGKARTFDQDRSPSYDRADLKLARSPVHRQSNGRGDRGHTGDQGTKWDRTGQSQGRNNSRRDTSPPPCKSMQSPAAEKEGRAAPARKHSNSPARKQGRLSPINGHHSRSPRQKRSNTPPLRQHSRSPRREQSRSPMRKDARKLHPVRKASPARGHARGRSPGSKSDRRQSQSPMRKDARPSSSRYRNGGDRYGDRGSSDKGRDGDRRRDGDRHSRRGSDRHDDGDRRSRRHDDRSGKSDRRRASYSRSASRSPRSSPAKKAK